MSTKKTLKKAIVGMALGDGHIDRSGGLLFSHSLSQEMYARAKYRILSERFYVSEPKLEIKNTTFGVFERITCRASLGKFGKNLRDNLYVDNHKIAPMKMLKFMGVEGLLFLFLDDGTLSISKRTRNRVGREAYLSVEGFDTQSRKNIINFLNNLGINSKDAPYKTRGKSYVRIRISAIGMRKMISLLHSSSYLNEVAMAMKYKLCPKYVTNRIDKSLDLVRSFNLCKESCSILYNKESSCVFKK